MIYYGQYYASMPVISAFTVALVTFVPSLLNSGLQYTRPCSVIGK